MSWDAHFLWVVFDCQLWARIPMELLASPPGRSWQLYCYSVNYTPLELSHRTRNAFLPRHMRTCACVLNNSSPCTAILRISATEDFAQAPDPRKATVGAHVSLAGQIVHRTHLPTSPRFLVCASAREALLEICRKFGGVHLRHVPGVSASKGDSIPLPQLLPLSPTAITPLNQHTCRTHPSDDMILLSCERCSITRRYHGAPVQRARD